MSHSYQHSRWAHLCQKILGTTLPPPCHASDVFADRTRIFQLSSNSLTWDWVGSRAINRREWASTYSHRPGLTSSKNGSRGRTCPSFASPWPSWALGCRQQRACGSRTTRWSWIWLRRRTASRTSAASSSFESQVNRSVFLDSVMLELLTCARTRGTILVRIPWLNLYAFLLFGWLSWQMGQTIVNNYCSNFY